MLFASAPLWILVGLWLCWILPFAVRRRGGGQRAVITAPKARWGMLLQGLAFAIVWAPASFQPVPDRTRVIVSVLLALFAIFIGLSATSALGKQWRYDAALNPDHHLIRRGPYSVVRHPIYASMLLMFVSTALIVSNWIAFCIALVFFLVGIETRVRIEEGLLIAHFGNEYEEYRRRVPAYIPGLR